MLRAFSCLLISLSVSVATVAAPGPQSLRITGRILSPAPAARVELVPVVSSYAEAVRLLADEPVPALATAQPRADGSFEIVAPESGLYRVRLRAEGRLPVEVLLIPLAEDVELPPVTLQPAPALQITVLGPDGQPVPRLRVRALSVQAFGLGPQIAWRPAQSDGVTDAAGRVTLPQGGVRELSFVALAPGVPDRSVETVDGSHHTLRLTQRAPRAVEVRGQDGKPLAGVLVRWNLMPFGLTGSDGRLALPASKSGATLRLEDAGGFLAEVPVPPEGEGLIAVRLPAGRTVTGRVLDAASRKPLAGALVWGGDHRHVRPAADGRFSLRVFVAGEATVDAAAAGHLPSSAEARPGDNQPMTLVLRPAATLAGIVTDGSGQPVPGAEIQARRADGRFQREDSPLQVPVLSGADGRFRLAGLAAGQMVEVTAQRAGFATTTLPVEAAPAGQGAPLRILLRRGATVAGRVVDAGGEPVSGAEILLLPVLRRSGSPEPAAVSDSMGRFHVSDLGSGLFNLQASHHGFAATTVRGVEIPAASRTAQTVRTVDLGDIALAPGAAIEGRVTDRRGAPVAKAEIGFSCSVFFPRRMPRSPTEAVATGPDGRFRIEDLATGLPCHLEIRHAGYTPAQMPGVKPPTREPLHIELAADRVLSGRVVGPLGEPVPRASISLSETHELRISGGGMSMSSMSGGGSTDAEGRFRLDELSAGPLNLMVSAPGYKQRTLQGIEVPEAGAPALEISLSRGETLTGTVMSHDGQPVPGATIRARLEELQAGRFQEANGTTDGDGRYRLDGLETAAYSATAESPDGQSVDGSVKVKPGVNQLDFTFPGGADVEGRVLDLEGAPLPGATASLRTVPEGRTFHSIAGAEGLFRIRAVADGDYLLAGQAEGFAETIQPGEIHVSGQAIQGLELRLERGTVLTGKLIGGTPEELGPTSIQAFAPPRGSRAFPSQTGFAAGDVYRISGLYPATWEVRAFTSDGRSTHGSVVIEPGMDRATLDLEFTAGLALSGRVLVDGAPLADAYVIARSAAGSFPAEGRAMTAWDGSFRITGLAPGRYRIAIAGHAGMGHSEEIEISESREALFEIATGSLGGEVLSATGAPVAGALVSLSGENAALASTFGGPTVRTDEQGRFEVSRLAAGSYRVIVVQNGYAPAEDRIAVTPGGTVQMQIVLKAAR